jgi:simple sugar transport system permease protein
VVAPVSVDTVIAAGADHCFYFADLNLKAIGSNPFASYLFGLKPARNMMLAMIFAGGFAGIAGSLQVTGVYHRLLPAISSNYGYLALLVAMLSNYNIWLVPLVAFFFACLNVGSIQLPMVLQLDSSLSGVIQGALVLATLGVHAWRKRWAQAEIQKSEVGNR